MQYKPNMRDNRYQNKMNKTVMKSIYRKELNYRVHHATTSAELKLLRRRRTLLSPGLSDLDPGTTIALGLFVIHASEAVPAILSVAAEATSLRELVVLCVRFAGMSVGSRDGVGDGGARGGRRAEGVAARAMEAAVFRVVVPVASLGILFGPFCLVVVVGGFPVTPAVDLNTRVGRFSEAVALGPAPRIGAFSFGLGITPSAGNTSALSSSSESTAILF